MIVVEENTEEDEETGGGRGDDDDDDAVVGGSVAYVGFGPQGRGGAGGGRWPAVPRARPPGEEVGVRTCTGH